MICPARVLRLLATSYIFTEVSPDVFTNNRLSSVLDTGKSVEELLTKLVLGLFTLDNQLRIVSPESKHIGTPGVTSILMHLYNILIGFPYGIYLLICFTGSTRASRAPATLPRPSLTLNLGTLTNRTGPHSTKHTMSRKTCGPGSSVRKIDCDSLDLGQAWMT